uniref:Uncharacterized protein n=1 Tax=Arundo donax TaxID=35708 RepID=A0A0A9FPQ0_ARUDO
MSSAPCRGIPAVTSACLLPHTSLMPAHLTLGIVEAPSVPHLGTALVSSHHLHVASVLSALQLGTLMSSHPHTGIALVSSLHPETSPVSPLHLDTALVSFAPPLDAAVIYSPAHLDIVPSSFASHLHIALVHVESSVAHLHTDRVSAAFHSHTAGVPAALYLGTGAMSSAWHLGANVAQGVAHTDLGNK